jgi:hypothetical protein
VQIGTDATARDKIEHQPFVAIQCGSRMQSHRELGGPPHSKLVKHLDSFRQLTANSIRNLTLTRVGQIPKPAHEARSSQQPRTWIALVSHPDAAD